MTHESNRRSRDAWQQHPLSSAPTLQTSMDSQGQTEALHSLPSITFSEAPSFTEIKSIPANRIGGAGGEARRGLAGWYEKKKKGLTLLTRLWTDPSHVRRLFPNAHYGKSDREIVLVFSSVKVCFVFAKTVCETVVTTLAVAIQPYSQHLTKPSPEEKHILDIYWSADIYIYISLVWIFSLPETFYFAVFWSF